jgi:hypothetical protein
MCTQLSYSLLHSPLTHTVTYVLCRSQVRLAGLGSRDLLRLEAGLCLHGNDLELCLLRNRSLG